MHLYFYAELDENIDTPLISVKYEATCSQEIVKNTPKMDKLTRYISF